MEYAELAEKIKAHKDEISKEIGVKPQTIVKWCDDSKRFLNVGVDEICTMAIIIDVHPKDVLNILENEVFQYMKKGVAYSSSASLQICSMSTSSLSSSASHN